MSTIKKSNTPPQPTLEITQEDGTHSLIPNDPPSSPFQTEVEQDSAMRASLPNPVKPQRTQRSPTKNFNIHEDTTELTHSKQSIATQSPKEQRSRTSEPRPSKKRAIGDITLSDIREQIYVKQAEANPSALADMRQTNLLQDDEDEHDMRSVLSDDTCFSAFSAVPNADMTMFAKLGQRTTDNTLRSPVRPQSSGKDFYTPSTSRKQQISRSPSPTPRGPQQTRRDGDTTNLLLDFTGQFDLSRSTRATPSRRGNGSPSKSNTEPNLLSYINNQRMPSPLKGNMATPSNRKNLMSLLDFDLPPQPTPRSIPTITVRELESLKSQYLSEISSLKASLSGREAEVDSLKKAVNDAERRVGEAQEALRDERNAREHAEKEKDAWAKKGQEVESVLQSVREEFVSADKEREELLQKLEESNRLREDAEMKMAEANTKVSVAQSEVGVSTDRVHEVPGLSEGVITQRVNEQLDEKMESLARELHTVYKKKHESKVATLKKTYETRSEKKCAELQQKIDDMSRQIEDLQSSRDATFSGELPSRLPSADQEIQRQRLEAQNVELEEHKARLAGLQEELQTMQQTQGQLMQDLERERVEKGELVAAVDEMLALQSEAGAPSVVEDFRRSISRPPSVNRAGGLPAPKPSGIAGPNKSRIMSNIERMGSSRSMH